MKGKPDSEQAPRIITVDQHSELERTTSVIPPSKDLDDQDILTIMQFLSDSAEQATTVERVSGQIAQQVQELEMPHGSELVIPVSRVITRSMIPASDRDLSELATDLKKQYPRNVAIQTGMELGDKATNIAAGILDLSRDEKQNLEQLLSVTPFQNLPLMAAQHGYVSAYLNARNERSLEAIQISAEVPILLRRFNEVVRLVSNLFN